MNQLSRAGILQPSSEDKQESCYSCQGNSNCVNHLRSGTACGRQRDHRKYVLYLALVTHRCSLSITVDSLCIPAFRLIIIAEILRHIVSIHLCLRQRVGNSAAVGPSSVDVLGKFRSFDQLEFQTSWHRLSDRPLAT